MKCLGVLALVCATALALDLDAVHRTSHRPLRTPSLHLNVDKRTMHNAEYAFEPRDDQERPDPNHYYRSLSPRMQALLITLMQENQQRESGVQDAEDEAHWMEAMRHARMPQMADIQPPYEQDEYPSASADQGGRQDELFRWTPPALPRVPLSPEYAYDKRSMLGYRTHKQLPSTIRVPKEDLVRKRSLEVKTTAQPAEVASTTAKSPVSAIPKTAVHIEEKPADQKRNKREMESSAQNRSQMSPEEFKRWMTEEYYRNMAMNFATMRKKRSVDTAMPERDPSSVFDQLKLMEQTLLQEALQIMQDGGSQTENRRLKEQVSERLGVAHDLQNLKKALQRLYSDSEKLKVTDEAQMMSSMSKAPSKDLKKGGCPELQMLSSGCSALEGMFPPKQVQDQFVLACNWHEVCYACGAQHGLSSDQCDQAFLADTRIVCSQLGSCNKQMVQLLLEPLHKKRIYFKRSSPAICERPCVASFLTGN